MVNAFAFADFMAQEYSRAAAWAPRDSGVSNAATKEKEQVDRFR